MDAEADLEDQEVEQPREDTYDSAVVAMPGVRPERRRAASCGPENRARRIVLPVNPDLCTSRPRDVTL